MQVVDEINIDYACRALLGGGKGKSVMEELKKVNQPYYDQIMSLARERLRKEGVKDGQLSDVCRECGSDMTSAEEEEQGICLECQGAAVQEVNTDYCDEPFLGDGSPNPRYNPPPTLLEDKIRPAGIERR